MFGLGTRINGSPKNVVLNYLSVCNMLIIKEGGSPSGCVNYEVRAKQGGASAEMAACQQEIGEFETWGYGHQRGGCRSCTAIELF